MSWSNGGGAGVGAAIRPELELILRCARRHVDAEQGARIRTCLGEVADWPFLLRTARYHGVTPLLYWHVSRLAPEALPPELIDWLRAQFHANASRNLMMAEELLNVLGLFGQHGIRAIPFKGPVLAATAYGNLALRMFRDLDVIIRRDDFPQAADLLVSRGYRRGYGTTARARRAARPRGRYHRAFLRDRPPVKIELHWSLTEEHFTSLLTADALSERLVDVPLGRGTVRTFCPEDLLLFLCVHGAKHYWGQLKWLCDVAELVRGHPTMDWGAVLDRATAFRTRRMLFLALRLAADLLGASPPGSISRELGRDPVARSLASRTGRRILGGTADKLGPIETVRFRFESKDCPRDAVWHVWGRLREFVPI